MPCISCTLVDADDACTKTIFEDFELRTWIRRGLIEHSTELWCIDHGTTFTKDAVSKHKDSVTYIGLHSCHECKCFWWVKLKKIMRADSAGHTYEEEAMVKAKQVKKDVAEALLQPSPDNYFLIATRTKWFEQYDELHQNYFQTIEQTHAAKMAEFYHSDKYQKIHKDPTIRKAWEDFWRRFSK